MSQGPAVLAGKSPGGGSEAFALLADMTRRFAATLELEPALEAALATIVEQLDACAGSLWLVDEGGETLSCRACVGPSQIAGFRLPLGEGIVGHCVRHGLCEIVRDAARDPRFTAAVDRESGLVTRSLLCVPLRFGDETLGAVEVMNRQGEDARFSEADLRPLEVLASFAALAIANARLTTSAVAHLEVRRELDLAAEIQRSLLPAARAWPFPVHGANVPVRDVSGDFYDVLPLADGRIAFCLGDVSGKGLNAAILMAKTASLYRCLAKSVDDPGALLDKLNDELVETTTRGMFVTMVAGVLEPESGVVVFANAGHEPPLHRTADGAFHAIPAQDPPLGIASAIAGEGGFPQSSVRLGGGALYLFSDGLTEAVGADGRPLEAQGVEALIRGASAHPPAERLAAVLDEVRRLGHRDDLTLLVATDEGRAR